MADPLSITASILAVLGAIRAIYKRYDALKKAPRELEDISQELDDVAEVLTVLAACLSRSSQAAGDEHVANIYLESLLRKTEEVVEGLHQCHQRHVTTRGAGSTKVVDVKSVAWIKDRSNIRRRRDHLKRLKDHLSTAISNIILSTLLHTQSKLTILSEAVPAANLNLNSQISLGFSRAETAQAFSASRILDNLGRLAAELQRTPPFTPPNSQILFPPLHPQNRDENKEGVGFPMDVILRSEGSSHRCRCQCHSLQGYTTPGLLKVAVGDLKFIVCPSKPCDDFTCKRRQCPGASNSTSFAWITPRWSPVQRAVLLSIATAGRPPSISVSLSFPRVVGDDALVFHYATIGNLDGMKGLFQRGFASPHDIKFSNGFTPFHYAVSAGRLEICKLLVDSNGKPTLPTTAIMSAAERAVNTVFSRRIDQESITLLMTLFKLHEVIESRKFTVIHELVIGLRRGSIREALKETDVYIDQADSMGRTPLSWAAQRGDQENVGLFVQYLADPTAADISGITPIHYAAQAGNVASLRYLLGANSRNVGIDNDRGWTPLHHATFFQNDPELIDLLLDNGADVDEQSSNGKTALLFSALSDTFRCAECLIRRGAQVNLKSEVGWSPLNVAVTSRSIKTLRVLIRAGADLKESLWRNENILHLLGRYPDIRMFECFMEANLKDLEIDAQNSDGDTPVNVLRQQKPAADQLQAFQQLLKKVLADKSGNAQTREPFDGVKNDALFDIFEDTIEYQEV